MTNKLMIGLPIYGGVPAWFFNSLLRLMQNPPCEIEITQMVGDSLVSRARNSLTATFLKSDCTHLLQIDSDLIFSPEQIGRLMAHPEMIVGGLYPKKQDGPVRWVCNACFENQPVLPSGLQQVRYIGTGFIRVAREVFDRMIVNGCPSFTPDDQPGTTQHDLWPVGVHTSADGSKRYLSEDWYFCQNALDLGYKVWADTRVILKHCGDTIFPLPSQEAQLRA